IVDFQLRDIFVATILQDLLDFTVNLPYTLGILGSLLVSSSLLGLQLGLTDWVRAIREIRELLLKGFVLCIEPCMQVEPAVVVDLITMIPVCLVTGIEPGFTVHAY